MEVGRDGGLLGDRKSGGKRWKGEGMEQGIAKLANNLSFQ